MSKYNKYSFREYSKQDSKYSRAYEREREQFHMSQSTLCSPHHTRKTSKSTLRMHPHQLNNSKSTLCAPYQYRDKHIVDKDVSSLPYYIVPVLYVPHKPLYDAKQEVEPNVYRAYHCKSKNHLVKRTGGSHRYPLNLSRSKSLLSLYSKKSYKGYDDYHDITLERKTDKNYSFEYYDNYIRKYIEEKKSSSDISFCTEQSYTQLPPSAKKSSRFNDDIFDLGAEKRKSISKDFPELFGLYAISKNSSESQRPQTGEEEPTWDAPRTANAFVETEHAQKSCTFAQTSLQPDMLESDSAQETQGTQTLIKDIKMNVLVVPNEKFKRSLGSESIPEEVPKNIRRRYCLRPLTPHMSDGQIDRKFSGADRGTARFGMSKLTKSAMSSSLGPSMNNSRRSMTK